MGVADAAAEPNNYTNMTRHFMQCVVNGEQPLVSGVDGAWTVEVMCAVWRSMDTGGWVDLPLQDEVVPPYYKSLPADE